MRTKVTKFEADYRSSLQDCLNGAGELALQHGYELGRQAIMDGQGVMDILSAQQKVLLECLDGAKTVNDCINIVKSSQNFLTECLAPFELTHRGFLEVESLNIKLEAANKDLESFSYSVSHDLRAPLRAIDGYSRMILRKQEKHFDKETLRQFNLIKNNVKTMGYLIDGLLAFSRFGKQKILKENLDIEGIIKDVWQNLLVSNPGRSMTLFIEGIRPGMGDRSLIQEVFSNLPDNAVKYTRTRCITRIETGSLVKDNETVYYVRDNGVGFEMKYYDKLFGIFQRLDSADEYEGTGLGLAIVQRIIHRHGGRIWAECKQNEGTIFYFTLPT